MRCSANLVSSLGGVGYGQLLAGDFELLLRLGQLAPQAQEAALEAAVQVLEALVDLGEGVRHLLVVLQLFVGEELDEGAQEDLVLGAQADLGAAEGDVQDPDQDFPVEGDVRLMNRLRR